MLRAAVLAFAIVLCLPCANSVRSADATIAAKVWRIGYVGNVGGSDPSPTWDAFLGALKERGYVEGSNITFERRFGQGRADKYAAAAEELIGLKVDLLVVASGAAARAAQKATQTIPIVMAGVADPVGQRLVASLAHPGGNITGVADDQVDLFPKRLELLKAALPKLALVGIVHGSPFGNPDAAQRAANRKEGETVARSLGLRIVGVQLDAPEDFESAKAVILHEHPDALLLLDNPVNYVMRRQIAEFAITNGLPTIAANENHARAGILISYGPDVVAIFRNAASYVDKILTGAAAPADMPVQQSSKYELIINLKTAKMLGLTVTPSLLLRADELIR